MCKLSNGTFPHVELRILRAQAQKVVNGSRPFTRGKTFWRICPFLWREKADPNLLDFGARAPVLQELIEVARSFHHLTRDGAMNNHVMASDVLKNSLVRRRLSPLIVFGLKAVD